MNLTTELRAGAQKVLNVMGKESPSILAGLAVIGVGTTMYLTIKATVEAVRATDLEIDNRYRDWEEETGLHQVAPLPEEARLTTKDYIQICWKFYIPPALAAIATGSAIIGSNTISLRRNAAWASLYALSETTLNEYKSRVIEQIGKNKEEKIQGAIDQDRLDHNPVSKSEVYISGAGKQLCYDSLSGRYFESDIESIRKIVNDFNARLMLEMYMSLNEFYDELGLPHTVMGESAGWDLEHGMLDIHYGAQLAEDKRPCIVLKYAVEPHPYLR